MIMQSILLFLLEVIGICHMLLIPVFLILYRSKYLWFVIILNYRSYSIYWKLTNISSNKSGKWDRIFSLSQCYMQYIIQYENKNSWLLFAVSLLIVVELLLSDWVIIEMVLWHLISYFKEKWKVNLCRNVGQLNVPCDMSMLKIFSFKYIKNQN